MKDLVDDVYKKILTLYFNIWKRTLPKEDDHETVNKTRKSTVIRRRIINLQKKTKEEEEPINLNLEIPSSPIDSTNNYLKNIRNRTVIQYNPEDVDLLPSKEPVLRNNIEFILEKEEPEPETEKNTKEFLRIMK